MLHCAGYPIKSQLTTRLRTIADREHKLRFRVKLRSMRHDETSSSSPFYLSPLSGGLDRKSSNSGCARLAPPLGVVIEEVAVLVILVRRHRCAVGAAVRQAVDDEVPGAIKEETGPAAVRRVPPGLLDALPVRALGALGIVVVVRDFWRL